MLVTPSLFASTGLVGNGLGVFIYNPADNSTLLAHTTGGITESPNGSGVYFYSGTIASVVSYIVVWDISSVVIAAEEINSPTVVGGAVFTQTGTTGPGTVFVIKRGDSDPPLTYQATRNGNPVDISGSTILFKMRAQPNAGALVINRSAVIADGPNGVMTYNWQHSGADTATAGEFDAEFQVTFADGGVETFPTTDPDADALHEYITIKIPSDLD